MNLRRLLFPAIALTVIGAVIKLCDTIFNVYGDGFIFNSDVCNITVAVCFILLFIIGYILSLSDRKKNFSAEPGKNYICGVFGFIASVALIGTGVVKLITLKEVNLAENIFAIAAGFVLLYEACVSFTGSNGMKKAPVVALIVPVWCCLRFISVFVDYTQKSLKAVELFDIIEVGFLIMFLFYQSMFFAGINNKLAIRRASVYGTVFIMLSLIVSADLFIKMSMGGQTVTNIDTQIVEPTITNIMTICGDLAFAFYAFFFLAEILSASTRSIASKSEPDPIEEELSLTLDEDENSGEAEKPAEDGKSSSGEKPEELVDEKAGNDDSDVNVQEEKKAEGSGEDKDGKENTDKGGDGVDELLDMLDNM